MLARVVDCNEENVKDFAFTELEFLCCSLGLLYQKVLLSVGVQLAKAVENLQRGVD